MDLKNQLPFKEGQLAEAKSFEDGFRGAWFRCKIKEISCSGGNWSALLEYFDYPDDEVIWTQLYQIPPYQSGKGMRPQLILRPQYPPVQCETRVPDVRSKADVIVAFNGSWKVNDKVDWFYDSCYWSGTLTEFLANGKAKIELVAPPLGEGETYEVFVKDLRPSLKWSLHFGWAVPVSLDGENYRQCAQLLQPQAPFDIPIIEGLTMFEGRRNRQLTTGSSSNASSSTPLSGNSLLDKQREFKATDFVQHSSRKEAANKSKDASTQETSSTRTIARSLPASDEKGGSKKEGLMERTSNIATFDRGCKRSKGVYLFGRRLDSPDAAESAGPTGVYLFGRRPDAAESVGPTEVYLFGRRLDSLDAVESAGPTDTNTTTTQCNSHTM